MIDVKEVEDKITIKKLKDLGNNLPVGVIKDGQLYKSFELRDLSTDIEIEFGNFRKRNKSHPETSEVTKLLSLLLTEIGNEPHVSLLDRPKGNKDIVQEEAEDLFKIGRLDVADAYYAYVYARIQELGEKYDVDFTCQQCGLNKPLTMDLTEMDVMCIENPEDRKVRVSLPIGFESPSGRNVKEVFVEPVRWTDLESDEMRLCEGDEVLMKLFFIKQCTTYEDTIQKEKRTLKLNQNQINRLKKFDRETIAKAVNLLNLGPSLHVNGVCPKCQMPFLVGVDWRYDNFFAISSL